LYSNFLDLARRGKNEWWRYVLSTMLILFFWLGGSIVLTVFMLAGSLITKDTRPSVDTVNGILGGVDPLLMVTVLLSSFLPLLAGVLLAVRFIHQRPVTSLITPFARIDWKRMGVGFLAFGALGALGCVVESLLYPGRYQFTFNLLETLKFAPVVLILVPLQAASEELLFRGYLMQGIGLLTRRAWIPVVLSSLVFTLLHIANPEAQVDTLISLGGYLAIALLFALVTLKDNRLELAIGMHIANNIFVLVVNNAISTLPVPSVFTVATLDAGYNLVSTIVIGVIFYAGLHYFLRPKLPGGAGMA
jgi:membrane protease YdiL (CAAX protease family)